VGKYDSMNVAALKAECKSAGIAGYSKLRKSELVAALEAHEGAQVPEEEPIPEPEPAKPVEVKGRSVGATTMAVEASKREPFQRYPNKQARNRAKARRRAIRAAGFQAGC
jgi:hypothetical protein